MSLQLIKEEVFYLAVKWESTEVLYHRFPVKDGKKVRWVNNMIPELKDDLSKLNKMLTNYFVEGLELHADMLDPKIPQAYLPNRGIVTNAAIHKNSKTIIRFDFKKFYDNITWELVCNSLGLPFRSFIENNNVKRLFIANETGSVGQGFPCSGILASYAMLDFWMRLGEIIDNNIRLTQYSDDLTFSLINSKIETEGFDIKSLQAKIKQAMDDVHRNHNLHINPKKTLRQSNNNRIITGVRINDDNRLTCSRKTYRLFRAVFHNLHHGKTIDEVLKLSNVKSLQSLKGKLNYAIQIDSSMKMRKLVRKYEQLGIKI
jgi:hypothetical protein